VLSSSRCCGYQGIQKQVQLKVTNLVLDLPNSTQNLSQKEGQVKSGNCVQRTADLSGYATTQDLKCFFTAK